MEPPAVILPWGPIVIVDIAGSMVTLLLALGCASIAGRWARRREDDNFRHYIFLLTVAIVFFAVSRSFGHLVKQVLLLAGWPSVWHAIAPYSGAVNSAAFVVIFAFSAYFQRFQRVHREIEKFQTELESIVEERTKNLEEAKERLERQNIELNKVDRLKDALIMDVSHELKTPVAKHAMQLEILRKTFDETGTGGAAGDALEVMESSVVRQKNVITNILLLSRLEEGGHHLSVGEVPVEALVEEVIEEYGGIIAAEGIVLKFESENVTVETDRGLLYHVLSNLLSNAIKYRGAEGPGISIESRLDGGIVRLIIEDNGIGMTGEEIHRAFERFYQVSASREGIGLGMAIARMIVSKLGGDIELTSQGKSRGTRVTVSLPAVWTGVPREAAAKS